MSYHIEPIAYIRTPYREKFATPRQPRLASGIRAEIRLLPEFSSPEIVRELDGFSHIWLLFLFDRNSGQGWHPTVRPPRMGGHRRVGVFASRSPFRPNPIGLSAVQLISIQCNAGKVNLEVIGVDLVDGTPILDIKPYIPYSDSIPDAVGGFAATAPTTLPVEYTASARASLEQFVLQVPDLELIISETLAFDPRPAYKRGMEDTQEYGALLAQYNVRWKVCEGTVIVLAIERAP